jgi:hypothetical protein
MRSTQEYGKSPVAVECRLTGNLHFSTKKPLRVERLNISIGHLDTLRIVHDSKEIAAIRTYQHPF